MSPSRAPARGYKASRPRREVALAVLGVTVVVLIAVVLIWVLAPNDPETDVPEFTPPPVAPPATVPSTAPPTTPSTAPG